MEVIYLQCLEPNLLSVQFSCSVVSDSLRPHELQHSRPPCPSPTPGAHPNPCPSSWWCHTTISSSVVPFPPALNLSQHQSPFQWVSSSHQVAKILQLQLQHQSLQWMTRVDTFRIDWFDLLAVQGTLKSLLQHDSSKASIFQCSAFCMVQLSYPCTTTGKTIALTIQTFASKVTSLLFHMLSRFVIAFLPRSKYLLFSWLQSPSAVIFRSPRREKSVTASTFSLFICYEVMGTDPVIFFFLMLSFKPDSLHSSSTFIKRLFSSSLLFAIRVLSSAYLRLLITINSVLLPFYLHGYFPSSCY